MKMTRLEWRYLQRIALDHPYYDTHKPPLSDTEARAIMEANNTMTGREFVDSIYAKLGMTRPEKKKERCAWLRNIGELFTVPPIRRIAIAVFAIILLVAFFAATPAGRAIAESVIHYIVTLFDDGSIAVNRSDSEMTITVTDNEASFNSDDWQETESSIVYVNSFDAFRKATGKNPAVLPLPYSELYYEYDEMIDYLKLQAFYETTKGKIFAYQIWDVYDSITTTTTGFMTYDGDVSIYYSIEDGAVVIMKLFEDSVWVVSADGSYTLNDLISIVNNS